MKIKKGAPVTVMSVSGQPIQGYVSDAVDNEMLSLFYVAFPRGSSASIAEVVRAHQDEGVHWIHGHHAPESPAVLALQAAWVLGRRF